MSYDPNWFYSSIAQATAAIVGLLGAVLAARMQDQHGRVLTSYENVRKTLSEFNKQIVDMQGSVSWFKTYAEKRVVEIEAALGRGRKTLMVQSEVFLLGGGWSGAPREIFIDHDMLASLKENLRLAPEIRAFLSTLDPLINRNELSAFLNALDSANPEISKSMSDQFGGWRQRIEAIESSNRIHSNVASIQLPATVVLVLVWLCFFGLIAPLYYLSAYDGYSKHMLLLAFSVGVMAVPLYIASEIVKIYRLKRVVVSAAP